jgi:hypothetical protein
MSKLTGDIAVLAELDRLGRRYEPTGERGVKVLCPFHDDAHSSCVVDAQTGDFKCFAADCGAKGDLVSFIARVTEAPRALVLEELGTRYRIDDVKIVEMEVVERWHQALWQAGAMLGELRRRAISDAVIRERRLGYDAAVGRITIPVRNARLDVVNVRKYLPGAPGAEKMRNMRGRGSVRWYPEDQLRFDRVALCGGELKSLAAGEELNQHGVGALWATMGEDVPPAPMLRDLTGKVVYVVTDVDAGGRAAAKKLCRSLSGVAAEVYDVLLPLDVERHPHGDVNDFKAAGGLLMPLLEAAEPWVEEALPGAVDEEPTETTLNAAFNARYAGRRVRVVGVVQAMHEAPYPLPRDVEVKCERDAGPVCALCPVFRSQDGRFTIPPESPCLLEMIDADKDDLRRAVLSACRVPRTCRVSDFAALSHYNVEDVRLAPQLEITSRASDSKMQPAVCVGEGMELNNDYEMVGRMHPHPRSQQSTLLISAYKPTKDALSTYRVEDATPLLAFRPAAWTPEALEERLDALYTDLEDCVTRIKFRRDAHVAMDMAYHSPLLLRVDGRLVKGWVEVLIVGDSSQGKSETAKALMAHYGLGEKVECKNATVPGLLGGLQQMGTKWFASWGFLPMHDRRLVVLEELKGAPVEVIARLTDMRSSGVAELPKIEKRRAYARTRIVALSNPRREGSTVGEHGGGGVEVVRELIGGLEDVRRFDACLVQDRRDVSSRELEAWRASLNGHVCRWSPEACRALVLWCWTRLPDQVRWEPEAEAAVLLRSTALCERFTDAVPIVDRGSMRFKLARLSAALAGRTFSAVEDDPQTMLVRRVHVDWTADWLDRMYSAPSYGYLDYTRAVRVNSEIADPDTLRTVLVNLPFPRDFAESALRTARIDPQDLMDWCAWDRREALELLSLLVRRHALTRDRQGYRKTEPFVALLKEMLDKGLPDRPQGRPERF